MDTQNMISIIITAHNEGILLHKTILSVYEAIDELKKHNIKHEIIIHADNPDRATKEYLQRYKNSETFRIFCNDFKDLGLSRNYAIKQARGDVVGVIDGDDLISSNWFYVAHDIIKNQKNPVIVHPEQNLSFGINIDQQVLWTQEDMGGLDDTKILLAGVNLWASCCVARRETFLNHPYLKAGQGYGNEDWQFNCATTAAGIRHLVAPQTVQFYRRKADSLLTANNSNKLIQWPNPLFDLIEYKKIPLPEESPKSKISYSTYLKKGIHSAYKATLKTPLKGIVEPTAKAIRKIRKSDNYSKIPQYVIEEWKKVNHIEAQLYPVDWRVDNVSFYTNIDKKNIGNALRILIEPMTAMPDYVFIIPWLKVGGGDKVVLNYIKALLEIHPDWHIAIITTEPDQNTWADKLPQNAYILEFGTVTKKLNSYERECVFSRLITELRCKKIHLINSQYGYNYISSHRNLFENHYDLSTSAFCFEYIPGTDHQGIYDYVDPYLVNIYPAVHKIFTDNHFIMNRHIELSGFDAKKFKVLHQPVEAQPVVKYQDHRKATLRLFWASRIAFQKAPDLLIKIAEQLSNIATIDVYGSFYEDYTKQYFDDTPNLSYIGKFDGIDSIDTQKYDAFLYTSYSDGVPNILLEVASKGIPIIASDSGGVSEFINRETGKLVSPNRDITAYVKAVKEIKKSTTLELSKMIENAQKLLQKQHSWDHFIDQVKKEF